MFETAEVGNKIEKEAFKKEVPRLREALLETQKELATSKIAVVILMQGVEGAGKSETVNVLLEWLDARGVQVHALGEPSDEERERPPFWRVWRLLPPSGHVAFFIGTWYTAPIIDRAFKKMRSEDFEERLERITSFERMLSNENVLVLKFWLHLSKSGQKKRLKELAGDPKSAWRVTRLDWKFAKRYERFRDVSEAALRKTDTGEAPWHIIEATDHRYRNATVAKIVLEQLKAGIERAKQARPKNVPDTPRPKKVNIINQLDMTQKVSEKEFEEKFPKLQGKLALLTRKLHRAKKSVILVFEGPDAAGKGGAIRRITQPMDARTYQVISIAAPTEEERAHPYLWRFWRHLPRLGRVTIYDRSWYGRVLVERLEGFCSKEDWQRAYSEINEFETQLTTFGIVVLKFWLAISPEEQLKRFKDREVTPFKQYKIGPEDWRNRAKWDAYEAAACDMIERTSTRRAPWVLVEANDKLHARMKVLKTVVSRLEEEL